MILYNDIFYLYYTIIQQYRILTIIKDCYMSNYNNTFKPLRQDLIHDVHVAKIHRLRVSLPPCSAESPCVVARTTCSKTLRQEETAGLVSPWMTYELNGWLGWNQYRIKLCYWQLLYLWRICWLRTICGKQYSIDIDINLDINLDLNLNSSHRHKHRQKKQKTYII